MYAIIETGGKQYRVEVGSVLDVELLDLPGEGKLVEFPNVLFFSDGTRHQVGAPYLTQCVVRAEYVEEVQGPKVVAYKYKQRKNSRRKVGHRQSYSRVRIKEIIS